MSKEKKELNEEDVEKVNGGGSIYNHDQVDGSGPEDHIWIPKSSDEVNGGGAVYNADVDNS